MTTGTSHRPAGVRHTGTGVGVVPSHFAGGGPLFLLRPPPRLSRMNLKNDETCRVTRTGRLLLDVLGEIPVETILLDCQELCLEPVDMLF